MFSMLANNNFIYANALPVPVLLPLIGAFLVYLLGKKKEKVGETAALVTVLLEMAVVLDLAGCFAKFGDAYLEIPNICGMGMGFSVDSFRILYMFLTAFMWLVTMIVSREYFDGGHKKIRYYFFVLLTLFATMGVFLSADLYTTFVFFEIMSFVSYVIVAQEENSDAVAGGKLYLGIAVFGGMIMLIGLMILNNCVGTVDIEKLASACADCNQKPVLYTAGALIAVGFAAKAGAFPLHIWLPKAHAVAPAPASAILSGILTKTGVFGILIVSVRIFGKCEVWYLAMLIIGVVTMVTGAVLALFSINIKRTLACSSVSQIGFILIGIGIFGYGNVGGEAYGEIAAMGEKGTIFFMVNHTLVKLLLFLVAGMIYHNMHSLDLNDLKGFGRKKPLLAVQFIIGAASLMGIPGTCGFISKSYVHESLEHFCEICKNMPNDFLVGNGFFVLCEKLFLLGSGFTAAYLFKLFASIFIEKNEDENVQKKMDDRKRYMSVISEIGMIMAMMIIPAIGLTQAAGMYTWANIKGILLSALLGVIVYFLVIRPLLIKEGRYIDAWPKGLELEKYFYMPIIKALCFVGRVVGRGLDSVTDALIVWLRRHVYNDELYEIDIVEGTAATKAIGKTLNRHQARKNMRLLRKVEEGEIEVEDAQIAHKDYVHEVALKYIWDRESRLMIIRTLSFGLSLFCIGFVLTMVYLLIKYRM